MAEEPGIKKLALPGKDFTPNRRMTPCYPGLAGATTETRQIQDYGAPQGWPPSAPASPTFTASADDPAPKPDTPR